MRLAKDSNVDESYQSSRERIPTLPVSANPVSFPVKGSLAYDTITDAIWYGTGSGWVPVGSVVTTPTLIGSTTLINASSVTGVALGNPGDCRLYMTGVTYGKLAIVTLNGFIKTSGTGPNSATWNALLPRLSAVTPIATVQITGFVPSGDQLPASVTLTTNGDVTIGGGDSQAAADYRFNCCFPVALF
jgi:hypothetical protein